MCTDRFNLRTTDVRRNERGMALLLVLLTLLLLSAIGLGMMYMSDTETSVNSNYRDTQLAFFAMRAGLEETRDRMRSNSIAPLTLPTAMPGAANSIVYVINPAGAADVVDPKNMANAYSDDEFCQQNFVGLPSGTLAGCGKTQMEPENSLVSTERTDKKKACVEKTSSSWTRSATSARSSEFRRTIRCVRCGS